MVTFKEVVIATALVMLQQGCTLVGVATLSPIVNVGTAADEQGTQMVV